MIAVESFLSGFPLHFPLAKDKAPWQIIQFIQHELTEKIKQLQNDYHIHNNIAIHRNAIIEEHVVLKGPVIIGHNCFVGAHAYLRGGVYLADRVSVGPGCEIKSSIVMSDTSLAHFNFAGDSLIGSNVNMEAGSVIANHYNEREDKIIYITWNGKRIQTGVTKFGALVGDGTKIGANAVLSPGTILPTKSIIKRLELVEQ